VDNQHAHVHAPRRSGMSSSTTETDRSSYHRNHYGTETLTSRHSFWYILLVRGVGKPRMTCLLLICFLVKDIVCIDQVVMRVCGRRSRKLPCKILSTYLLLTLIGKELGPSTNMPRWSSSKKHHLDAAVVDRNKEQTSTTCSFSAGLLLASTFSLKSVDMDLKGHR
jgi:hypothetical protein